jgi:hypothetical protein
MLLSPIITQLIVEIFGSYEGSNFLLRSVMIFTTQRLILHVCFNIITLKSLSKDVYSPPITVLRRLGKGCIGLHRDVCLVASRKKVLNDPCLLVIILPVFLSHIVLQLVVKTILNRYLLRLA